MKNKDIKVCGIVGRPNRKSYVDLLVTQILRGAQSLGASVKKYYLEDMYLNPVRYNNTKSYPNYYHFNNEISDINQEFETADAVVLGSPIYFYAIKNQTLNPFTQKRDHLMPYYKKIDAPDERGTQMTKKGIFVTEAKTVKELNSMQKTVKEFCKWANIKLVATVLHENNRKKLRKLGSNKKELMQIYNIGQKLINL